VERRSKLSLVDLAGSERAKSTGCTGDRLREASNINKSLSTLSEVIKLLAKRRLGAEEESFVPFRNSVLTWLLKESIGGNSKTVMVATLSPSASSYNETLGTLRYAERAKQIVNVAVVNSMDTNPLVQEMRRKIHDMQRLLMVERQERVELVSVAVAGRVEQVSGRTQRSK
jgi:hypothetical protein